MDYNDPNLADTVRRIAPGGVAAVFDNVGGIPNGKDATFYDLWAGHNSNKARYRAHLDQDPTTVLELVRDGLLTAEELLHMVSW